MILRILLRGSLVQSGFWLKIADAKRNAPMIEAVPQNEEQSVHVAGILKCRAEFPHGIYLICLFKAFP